MLLYYLKCRKNTEKENPKVARTNVVIVKKSKFVKQQEASELLGSLGVKTPLSKTPLVGPFCFRDINKSTQDIK